MRDAPVCERRAIAVRGIVQGVGFRPFIHALAHRHGLAGSVRNDAEGVSIEVEGAPEALDCFLRGIREDAPPLALVESVTWERRATRGTAGFQIEESRAGAQRRALVSPDVATCAACLQELFDPADRRYLYPFINCTNCGPRFTITRAVPYDRAMTTMAGFIMCPDCQAEYDDPANRRFHAQPNACPRCGPRVRLLDSRGGDLGLAADEVIVRAARLLGAGAIVAVKGLGGYHLACDPFDTDVVERLRGRKMRQDKPFALMAADPAQVRSLCDVGAEEEALLTAPARPIVLLARRTEAGVAEAVAPRQNTLGVMLAYTPLHHLLLHETGGPLVMTSGNRSDEPIAYRDEDALARLSDIADYFLVHDRPIHMRCDDSVVRVAGASPYPLRRSRGYAPAPLTLPEAVAEHVLVCGGELKHTFCLVRGRHAFLSQHIGDLENYETFRSFQEGVRHYARLFDVRPRLVAYDLHPDYLSTKYARELEEGGLPAIGVQHHHAHIASCLVDNERPYAERVIGVALDGTGYGTDGAIWGGEWLTGSIDEGFTRLGRLEYAPLPGGEAAVRQPWRQAIARLIALYGVEETARLPLPLVRRVGERNVRRIAQMMAHQINTPQTSSAGRLFDAVAALLNLPGTQETTYEGQAAIELELLAEQGLRPPQSHRDTEATQREDGEALATGGRLETGTASLGETPAFRPGSASFALLAAGFSPPSPDPPDTLAPRYSFTLRTGTGTVPPDRTDPSDRADCPPEDDPWVVETGAIIAGVVENLLAGRPAEEIAAAFHRTMAAIVLAVCARIRARRGVGAVALSGGVFQNMLLLGQMRAALRDAGFVVYHHRRVPANDGGLALGQAALADSMYRQRIEREGGG